MLGHSFDRHIELRFWELFRTPRGTGAGGLETIGAPEAHALRDGHRQRCLRVIGSG